MPTRRHALVFAAAIAAALSSTVAVAGMSAFGTANFKAALDAGGPVLVHVDATWCPTCRAQKPVLAGLLSRKTYMDIKAFSVDYDTEKVFMREIRTPDRSTIVVFNKGREVARSTGDTAEAKIEALIQQAM